MEIEFNNEQEFVSFLKRLTNKTLITRERSMKDGDVTAQVCVETTYTFMVDDAGKPCMEINRVEIPV